MIYVLGLLVMTLCGAIGGLFLKKISLESIRKKKLYFFFLGATFYGLGAILNIVMLQFLPYVIVFPLTAFTYVWTMVVSYFFMKEQINRYKVLGVACILIGALLVTL